MPSFPCSRPSIGWKASEPYAKIPVPGPSSVSVIAWATDRFVPSWSRNHPSKEADELMAPVPAPPKAPNRFTGGLYLKGKMANCTDFHSSEQWQHADYVTTVAPAGAGTTPGMLGYMFWAAEYPSARKNYVATVPPNTCEDGMGVAATVFDIPIPMKALRQH